jgi:hypothetical protein
MKNTSKMRHWEKGKGSVKVAETRVAGLVLVGKGGTGGYLLVGQRHCDRQVPSMYLLLAL